MAIIFVAAVCEERTYAVAVPATGKAQWIAGVVALLGTVAIIAAMSWTVNRTELGRTLKTVRHPTLENIRWCKDNPWAMPFYR